MLWAVMGITWVAPALLAVGAAAVLVPVALHLLSRLRRTAQPWPAVRFVHQALRRTRRKIQAQRLVLLALRCLVLLLAGVALAGPMLNLGGAGGGGRQLHVVLDDTLASLAVQSDGRTQWAHQLERGVAAAGELSAADRLHVWRVSDPGSPVAATGPGEARALLERQRPGVGGGSLARALGAVAEATGGEAGGAGGTVLVLSGLTGPVLDEEPSASVAGLGDRVRVMVSPATPPQRNRQVTGLVATPRVVLPESGGADGGGRGRLSVAVTLSRAGDLSEPLEAGLVVRAVAVDGQVLAERRDRVAWLSGQAQRVEQVQLDLPGETSGAARDVAVVARLSAVRGEALDVLGADDVRVALVQQRPVLRVAVVGGASAAGEAGGPGDVTPAQWLRLALGADGADVDGGVVAVEAAADELDVALLESVSAVVLLEPQRVTGEGWRRVREWVEGGGLLWVMPGGPAEAADGSWLMRMVSGWGGALPWSVDAGVGPGEGEELAVLDESGLPGLLSVLSSNWSRVASAVRVDRWVGAAVPGEDVWLSLRRADGQTAPLLAGRRVGRGLVVWMTVGPGPAWSNLALTNAWVPLVQQVLRGGAVAAGQREAVAGEPGLGEAVGDGEPALGLGASSAGEVVMAAGVYRPAEGGVVAVNVEASAGDLSRPSADGHEAWLSALGPWVAMDDAGGGAGLWAERSRRVWTWPLLWAVLAVLLGEAVVARWVARPVQAGGGGAAGGKAGGGAAMREAA
jgi:hypothetical protein